MRIGLDLDNTLIYYDDAFAKAAQERGLLPAGFKGTKQQLRDALRALPDGETAWQKLQGYVYGKGIAHASLFEGVVEFLKTFAPRHELFIVSHKTEFGHFDPDRVNLREAALAFLARSGVFEFIKPERIFFESTREEKIATIRKLSLDCFVDDLVEVFEEPDFPPAAQKILFHASALPAPRGGWLACAHWQDIKTAVAARALVGKPVTSLAHAAGGGNSRIYKIMAEGKPYALKLYPAIDKDLRDRLGTEQKALQWFSQIGLGCVPRWMAGEPPHALMEWVEGEPVREPSAGDVAAAVDFLGVVFAHSQELGADAMPPASEACLSGMEIVAQLHRRLQRLHALAPSEPLLAGFLQNQFLPAMKARINQAQALYRGEALPFEEALPGDKQRLIPADFGFHNALRMESGKLVFIDFEYFGWDDPVKLISDFLLHPAMQLTPALKEQFRLAMLKSLSADASAAARLSALYPLFGLRWTLILLNEFLPERWQARAFARGDENWEATKRSQLEKAQAMLNASESI